MGPPRIYGRREWWSYIVEDFHTNLGQLRSPGFRVLFLYRLIAWSRSLRPRMLRGLVLRILLMLFWRVRVKYGIDIKETTHIGRRLAIRHHGGIVIHRHARIGDDCTIRQGVSIGSGLTWNPNAPRIGDRVSIGANSTITGEGLVIEDDAIIGPNVSVFFDVPRGAIVVVPRPRVLGARDPAQNEEGSV